MRSVKLLVAVTMVAVSAVSYAEEGEVEGEYDNLCVTGLSMGKEVETDCSINVEMDDKIYCFSSPKAKAAFEKNPQGTIKKADATFTKLLNE